MLLPEIKEREYRFRLALRMGLPIFALVIALVSHTLIGNYDTLQASFYVESLLLLVFSIYFFLYLIYNGYDVKITDDISKTFTREYLMEYLRKELIKSSNYTLVLVSIDNLHDINNLYGLKNGDKVLEESSKWLASYLEAQNIENFPLGHIKGGDFILGLEGLKEEYNTTIELMCLKSREFKVGDIEIKLSASITDTAYSKDLDYMVERLFTLQEEKRHTKEKEVQEALTPNELESAVLDAIENRRLSIMTQNIFEDEVTSFKECYVKLKSYSGKLLYQKSFMKIINKLGLGVEYDLMVLETILQNKNFNNETVYALNISPTSLRNNKFLSATKELLTHSSIKVMFILSEAEYFSHTSRYNSLLSTLKRSGVLIAIDRLGSIHTSFLYLRELDIDVVRFDTYYSSLQKLETHRAILDGFNSMAHEKGLKTWIKNLEDDASLALAKELKIDYTEGKILSNLEKIYEN